MSTSHANPGQSRNALGMSKEERAREAAQAMREYQAEQLAVQAKTERLRALRLAKEAASPRTKTTPRRKRQDR